MPSRIFLPEEKKFKQVSEANTLPPTLVEMLNLLQILFDISSPVLKELWQLDWWMEGTRGSLAVIGPSLFTAQTLLCYPLRRNLRKVRLKKYCRSLSICTLFVNVVFVCMYKWKYGTSFSIRKGHNIHCSRILHVGQNGPCSSGAACKQNLFLFRFKYREQSSCF